MNTASLVQFYRSAFVWRRPGLFGLAIGLGGMAHPMFATEQVSISAVTSRYASNGASDNLSLAAVVGDINATGQPDLVVGSPKSDASAFDAGSVYLVFDGNVSLDSMVDVSTVSIRIDGEMAGDNFGARVSGKSDLNGDGIPDLAIASPSWNNARGRVYIFFGRADWNGLSAVNADLILSGEQEGDRLGDGGFIVNQDVNDDGRGDLIVSSPGWNADSFSPDRGRIYILLGNSIDWATRDLASADTILEGEWNGDQVGYALTGIGDVNDDGIVDWAASAPFGDDTTTDTGGVYVFFGDSDLAVGINGIFTTASFRMRGDSAGDQLGWSLAAGGDIDDDGYADFLAGAPGSDINGTDCGRVYVVYGRRLGWPLAGSPIGEDSELTFYGHTTGEMIGSSDSLLLLDISADGNADIVLTSRSASQAGVETGTLYAFVTGAGALGASNDVGAANLVLTGEREGDLTGTLLANGSGNLDEDIRPDVLVGAAGADAEAPDGGLVYRVGNLAWWIDVDGDSYTPSEGDCNDNDASINPGVTTDDRDGEDNDCDGEVDEDAGSGGCRSSDTNKTLPHSALAFVFLLPGLLLVKRRRS